jgi:outer membrane protein OmpA-like peptidoglycan-associated protein
VLDHFASQKVNALRLDAHGRGETEPRADNATEAGRQLNRRVELWIVPVVEEKPATSASIPRVTGA